MSQWIIIICFILVNVAVLVQSSSTTPDGSTTVNQPSTDPSENACGDIRVSNPMYWSNMDGIYEKMSSDDDCEGRPAYKQLGSSNYMYYDSRGYWVFGSTRCGDEVGIKSLSTAVSPDKVTSTWEEFHNGNWVTTPSLDVSCYNSSSCGDIKVSNSMHQADRHGIYEKMSNNNGCVGRPAYDQIDSSNYMYYRSTGHWVIGPTRCGHTLGIKAVSTAVSPDKVTSTWDEVYDGNWVTTPSLDVSCYYPPPCGDIRVSNPMYWSHMDGIYENMSSNDDCDGRPAYKQIGSSHYMYYENSGHWVIGSTRCGNIVGIKAVSTAASPDKVTSTWEEVYDEKWVATPSLDVICYYTPACGQIEVSNSRYQSTRHGIYDKLSSASGCAGRPQYKQSSRSNYMFYDSGYWWIGPDRCGDTVAIKANSTALSPDKVTSTWEEVVDGTWVYTSDLDVSCYSPPIMSTTTINPPGTDPNGKACDKISVSNAVYQTAMNGIYQGPFSMSCGGRQSYMQIGSSNYIFYPSSSGPWAIGPTICSAAVHGIKAESTATSPEKVTSTWKENNGTAWVDAPSLLVTCYTPNTPPSTDPNEKVCSDDVSVSNSRYQSSMHGDYEQMSSDDDCAGRPAYKQIGSSNYIYYDSSGIWLIGPTRCGDQAGIRAVSTAAYPDKVTSNWQEVYRNVWWTTSSLDVTCSKAPNSMRLYVWFIPAVVVSTIISMTLSV